MTVRPVHLAQKEMTPRQRGANEQLPVFDAMFTESNEPIRDLHTFWKCRSPIRWSALYGADMRPVFAPVPDYALYRDYA